MLYLSRSEKDIIDLTFIPVVKEETHLKNGSSYHLQTRSNSFLGVVEDKVLTREFLLEKHKNSDIGKRNKDYFSPLGDSSIEEQRKPLCAMTSHIPNESNAMKFHKLTSEERFELLFLRSFVKNTMDIHLRIMDNKKKNLNYKYVGSLNRMLNYLLYFLCGKENLIKEGDAEEILEEVEPIAKRQMMLRDIGLIDILVKICYLPLRLHNIALTTRTQTIVTLKQTMSSTYDCIKYSVAEYRPNELYLSQWLGLFIEDTFKNNSNVLEKAESTLKELIDNNEKILRDRIDKDIVSKFVMFLARVVKCLYRIQTQSILTF